MRALVMVVLIACGGGKAPAQAPVSNATPPADAPAAKQDEPVGDAMAKMSAFRDHMCACKDRACADHVNEGFTRWAEDMSRDSSKKLSEITEDDAKRITDTTIQYQECYTKLSTPTP